MFICMWLLSTITQNCENYAPSFFHVRDSRQALLLLLCFFWVVRHFNGYKFIYGARCEVNTNTAHEPHTKKWVKWSSLCSCVLCHLFQLLLSRPLIHSARCLSFLSVYLKCYTRITMRLYHCCGCELVQNESHCSVITEFSPFLLPAGCPAPTMRAK